MHYFQFNIKSYRANTAHLTNDEDLTYRRLIELYYDSELPIPDDNPSLSRRLRVDIDSLLSVLNEFFVKVENGWIHPYCDKVISDYHSFIVKQRSNGARGGRPVNPDVTHRLPTANPPLTQAYPNAKPTINHKPLTINHKEEQTRGSRLPKNFNPEIEAEAESGIDRQKEILKFCDYWTAKAGAGGVKLDWQATWRNWARSATRPSVSRFEKPAPNVTVPSSQIRDPELIKRENDEKLRVKPNAQILEKLKLLKTQGAY